MSGVAQREAVLKLACVLVDGCGVACTLSGGRDKKFLLLIVHLICIEVRMALEDHNMEQVLTLDYFGIVDWPIAES